MDALHVGYSKYGGDCPSCSSSNTALWMREVEVPNGYNDWQEWLSCHDCKHTWTEDSDIVSHTYLLNNGWTEESIKASVAEMRRRLDELLNKHKGAS